MIRDKTFFKENASKVLYLIYWYDLVLATTRQYHLIYIVNQSLNPTRPTYIFQLNHLSYNGQKIWLECSCRTWAYEENKISFMSGIPLRKVSFITILLHICFYESNKLTLDKLFNNKALLNPITFQCLILRVLVSVRQFCASTNLTNNTNVISN